MYHFLVVNLELWIGIPVLFVWTVVILILPVTILSVIFFRLLYIRIKTSKSTSPPSRPVLKPRRSQLDALPAVEAQPEDDKESYMEMEPNFDDRVYDQMEY